MGVVFSRSIQVTVVADLEPGEPAIDANEYWHGRLRPVEGLARRLKDLLSAGEKVWLRLSDGRLGEVEINGEALAETEAGRNVQFYNFAGFGESDCA
jgi:hypothetical protein